MLEYHERSLSKMVVDLFPEIGASQSAFKGVTRGECRGERREKRGGSDRE